MNACRPVLAMTLFVLLLVACEGKQQRAPVVMIGIDGAEWDVINAMIADGELPNLARIKHEGAWGYLLNPGPAVSPVVWTSFVTGLFGRQHGILQHAYPYTDEDWQRPVSSELRQVPALWNIASHHGLRSSVIGYFVTHPAETIDGVVVSPRAPWRLEGSVAPADALTLDAPAFQELLDQEVKQQLWSRFLAWDYDPRQAKDEQSPFFDAATIVKERNIDSRILDDEFLHRAAMQLAQGKDDLFIAYYRLTDFMSHTLWLYYDDSDFSNPAKPELQALFGESLKESYRFTDEAIGELLVELGEEANVLLVSDHGFGSSLKMEQGIKTRSNHLTGNHRPNGVILATGPDIQPGEIHGMTIMEVAPTLMALLGLPLSGELPGNIATDLLRPGFLADHPVRTTTNYADVTVAKNDVEFDRAMEEQDLNTLRGLGYVGEDIGLAADNENADYNFWAVDPALISSSINAEIVYYLLQGDLQAARDTLDLLRQHRPDLERLLHKKVLGKYLAMTEQLPPDYIDPAPFEAFFEFRTSDVDP